MPSYMIISGVGVPLRRGFVLPRVATRWLVALPSSSMPPTGRKEASDFWPCPSTGRWGCSRPRWLRRWPTRPGQLPSVLWQISTDQVQRGAGEALWSHPGRRPCCRPPCSPAQRGCPGDTLTSSTAALFIFLATWYEQELSYRHNMGLQRARNAYWQIFPFQVDPEHNSSAEFARLLWMTFFHWTGVASAQQQPVHHPLWGLDCWLGWSRLWLWDGRWLVSYNWVPNGSSKDITLF